MALVAMTDPQPIRPASSVLVWRQLGGQVEVLCGVRNPNMAFAGGQIVFPGGRLERGDAHTKSATALGARTRKCLQHESRHSPEGLAQAGLRELMEETGLVVGQYMALGSKLRLRGDFASLEFLSRAITPPRNTRRYDARFFALPMDAVTDKVPALEHHEFVALDYRPITELLEGKLMPPTRLALMQLGDHLQGQLVPKMLKGPKNIYPITV